MLKSEITGDGKLFLTWFLHHEIFCENNYGIISFWSSVSWAYKWITLTFFLLTVSVSCKDHYIIITLSYFSFKKKRFYRTFPVKTILWKACAYSLYRFDILKKNFIIKLWWCIWKAYCCIFELGSVFCHTVIYDLCSILHFSPGNTPAIASVRYLVYYIA